MADRPETLLGQMTLDEKLALVAGVDMWSGPGVPRLGVPRLKVSDGPHGARGASFTGAQTALALPCGSALGSTWNPELLEALGGALAEETRTKGAQVLLAPTVNLHRSPLAGRNFECYAEDPVLSGHLAAAFVRGLQGAGVGACIKHFACNESEFERHTISSEVNERSLRELYLRPFEIAIDAARPWSLMSAYNKVNGSWSSEHEGLLRRILKEEWGFDGFVVSDWFGTNSTVPVALAGLDWEMPGPGRHFGAPLAEAVQKGEVPVGVLDDKVLRLLRACERTGLLDAAPDDEERSVDRPAHRELARRACRESIVLLRNEGRLLPLEPAGLRRLAVIGPAAEPGCAMGGGSSRVAPHYTVSILEGLRERVGDGCRVVHEIGCTSYRRLPLLDAAALRRPEVPEEEGLTIQFFAAPEPGGAPVLEKAGRRCELSWFGSPAPGIDAEGYGVRIRALYSPERSGRHRFGLASAGRARLLVDGEAVVDLWEDWTPGGTFYGMGSEERTGEVVLEAGRPVLLEVEISKGPGALAAGFRLGHFDPVPDDSLERAERAAREAEVAVVCVGLDAEWETEGEDRRSLSLPGRQAELVSRVAAAQPRTVVVLNCGSPVDLEPFVGSVPALLQLWYPGQEGGRALAEILFGDASPSGRLSTTFPKRLEDTPAFLSYPGEHGRVRYAEGLFLGHRFYDARRLEPRFPFGHGLSYLDTRFGPLELEAAEVAVGEPVRAALEIANTGERAGQEVVQLYLEPVDPPVQRPLRELCAFAKVALGPGETVRVALDVEPRCLRTWDPAAGAWVESTGAFRLRAGASSRDLRSDAHFFRRPVAAPGPPGPDAG